MEREKNKMSVLRHPKEEDIRDIGKGHLGISTQVQGQTDDDNDDGGYFIRFLHFFPDSMFFYDYGALVIIHYSSLLTIIAPMRSAVRIAGRIIEVAVNASKPDNRSSSFANAAKEEEMMIQLVADRCRPEKMFTCKTKKKLGDALI